MAREPSKTVIQSEYGVAGQYDPRQGLRGDEFLYELRGRSAIRKFREMRENDPIVGAILTAFDMFIRSVEWKVEPPDGVNTEMADEVEFVQELFDDMEHSWTDFVSDVLSFLPFGFSYFEIVGKKRPDGRIGLKKLAPRAQWTIDRFDVAPSGEILGAYQRSTWANFQEVFIPYSKALLFRTTTVNNDPSGRSVLRNAYIPYYYVTHIQSLEAIAIERELNGLPLGRVPAAYLSPDASDAQKAFVNAYKDILAKVRKNEVGYMLIPSDVYEAESGAPTNNRIVDFELVASKGTRDIDTGKVIQRHQQNIARTVLADFIMLGSDSRGSYAMSENKSNLFLKSIIGHLNTIADQVNRRLIPMMFQINGMDPTQTPRIMPQKIAPVDLDQFGLFVERLAGVRPGLAQSDEFLTHVLEQANFPTIQDIPEDPAPPPAPAFGAPPEGQEEPPEPPQEGEE